MVEVLALNIAKSEKLVQMNHLPAPDKRKRISSIKHRPSARQILASDLLARAVICNRLARENQSIEFGFNENGKPFLRGGEDFHFNMSHAGDWVVMAISSYETGIDIEKILPLDIEIARHFFTSFEYQQLKKVPAPLQLDHFFQIWTLKESYSKMIGAGLSMEMNSFSIELNAAAGSPRLFPDNSSPVFFRQYDFVSDYKLSVCSREDSFTAQIIEITEDVLLSTLAGL